MITSLLLLRILGLLTSGTLTVETSASGPVEIVWDGCEAERAGPVCVTRKGDEIVVWARPEQPVACDRHAFVLMGSGHRTLDMGAVDGGCWTRVVVEDPEAGSLELRSDGGRFVWSMRFDTAGAGRGGGRLVLDIQHWEPGVTFGFVDGEEYRIARTAQAAASLDPIGRVGQGHCLVGCRDAELVCQRLQC